MGRNHVTNCVLKYKLNQIYNADEFGLYRFQSIFFSISKIKNALVGSTARYAWQYWQRLMQLMKNCQCLSLVRPNHLDVSNMQSTYPNGIVARRRVGWMAYYSSNGFVKFINNLRRNDKTLIYYLKIVEPPSHWESRINRINLFATEYYLKVAADGPGPNLII